MSNEILIPVRRRHAATRADLELMVTKPQHWGYAENEDLILTRRIAGTRRYFSRSALCRPGTVYDPVVTVDTRNFVGINCTPSPTHASPTAVSVLELAGSLTNTIFEQRISDFLLVNSAEIHGDGNLYRTHASYYPKVFGAITNGFTFYVGATGAVGSQVDITAATTLNNYYNLVLGNVFNANRGDFDFVVSTVASANSLNIDGTLGNIGIHRAPDPYNIALHGISIGLNAGIMTAKSQTGIYMLSNCYTNQAANWVNITAADASGYFHLASIGEFAWHSDPAAPVGAFVPTNKMILDINGNLRLYGVAAINATAQGCLVLANKTAPNAHDDNQIYIYAQDAVDVVESTLALYTERSVESTVDIPVTHYLEVMLNGTHYGILLNSLEA